MHHLQQANGLGAEALAAAVDRDLRLVEASGAFAALAGRRPEELLGQPLAACYPDLAGPAGEVLASGRPQSLPCPRSGGGPGPALRLTPVLTARGTAMGVELTIEAPGAVRPAAPPDLAIQPILNSLFAFVGVLLPDGTLIEANRAALEAASLRPEDVLGRPFEEAYWWAHDRAVQAQLREAIARAAAGSPSRYDVPVRLAPGHLISIDFMLAPLRDDQGRVQYLIPSAIDISERKRVEAVLLERERHLSLALSAAHMGTWEIDLDSQDVRRSGSTDLLFGLEPDGSPRQSDAYFSRIHPDDLARVNESIRLTVEEGAEHAVEYRVVWPDGRVRWLSSRGELIDEGGRPKRLAGALVDVTERRAVEADLRFQAQLLDAVGQGVIATDLAGTVRYWNRFAEQLYGWQRGEALGRNILDLVSSDISLQQGAEIMGQLQAGQPWAGTYFVRRRDGSIFPAFVTDVPVYGPDGQVTGIVGVSADISDQMVLEAEREELLLRERAARQASERNAGRLAQLQAVTAALSEALTPYQVAEVVVTRSMAVFGAAAATLRLVSPDQRSLETLYSSNLPAAVVSDWRRIPLEAAVPATDVARSGAALYFESCDEVVAAYPHMGPQVSQLGYGAFAVAPLSIEGRGIGSLVLSFAEGRSFADDDRSLLQALALLGAQAIERARLYDAARDAIQARDTFIAIASHDLRSPLTVLMGQAQLLERRMEQEGLPAPFYKRAQAIMTQAQRINRMVGAIFDLSRIQSGQLSVERVPLDIAALAARVVAELAPTLSRHRLDLVGDQSGLWVAGDEVRLEHVLYNLISNAVKYSPGGGVVRVEVGQADGQAAVTVADEGIGIPPEALPRLFDRYYRAANAERYGIHGLGIGLYAAREILSLHGGAVDVTSEEGRGSTFTVRLPLLERPG